MSVKPIFIFSLPRAGSTLLQRLLSLHENIDTQAEPWLALPLFFALKSQDVSGIYGHRAMSSAMNGYIDSLPGGKKDYYDCVSGFLNELYDRGSTKKALYFIDKTPRYHLIVEDIMLAFPDAKIIFLWRNPLSIASSMIKTWGKGKWCLYMFNVDLYSGIHSLVKASQNSSNSLSVKYEDLVQAPETQIKKIFEYLDLKYEADLVDDFMNSKTIDAPGRGDPVGQYKYSSVSTGSEKSWKKVMVNPYRKFWGGRYLSWIGKDRLEYMGYNKNELQSELNEVPKSYQNFISDILRSFYGLLYNKFCIEDIRRNKSWKKYIYFPKT